MAKDETSLLASVFLGSDNKCHSHISKHSLPWEETHFDSNFITAQKTEIKRVLMSHRHCIALGPNELGCTPYANPTISTGDSRPIHRLPRRLTPAESETIKRQVTEMLKNGVASSSTSLWSSPVVSAKKKTALCGFAWTIGNSIVQPSSISTLFHILMIPLTDSKERNTSQH